MIQYLFAHSVSDTLMAGIDYWTDNNPMGVSTGVKCRVKEVESHGLEGVDVTVYFDRSHEDAETMSEAEQERCCLMYGAFLCGWVTQKRGYWAVQDAVHAPVTVTIQPALHVEDPIQCVGWKLYSFNTKHCNFKHPQDLKLGDIDRQTGLPIVQCARLRRRFAAKLAFFVSYYEHSDCIWFRADGSVPGGVEFQWDGRRIAGLLVFDGKPSELKSLDPESRVRYADSLLQQYTDFCNGAVWTVQVLEQRSGECIAETRSYFDSNYHEMLHELADILSGREFTFPENFSHWEVELRKLLESRKVA